ncbi:MAG TPA: DUF4173 domain-containing protein [Gemmatimonadaceae bacterium]|nr:DUF4173 domain-containing protein [Gemmatimonadaceae bacterium]
MATTLDPSDTSLAGTTVAGRRPSRTVLVPIARLALFAAIGLGFLGDALLRDGPTGIGFTLFVAALVGVLAWLTKMRRVRWTLGSALLVPATLWFAAAITWRDSGALAGYNVLALLAALSALSWALLRGDRWEPGEAGVGAYVGGAVKSGLSAGVGVLPLLVDARIDEMARADASRPRRRTWPAVARGALVAAPVLLVFGALFSAADQVFARIVGEVFDIDVFRILSHLLLAGFIAWPVAGYLRGAAVAPIDNGFERSEGWSPKLGVIEVGVVLGALDALFLLFVVVQIRYLFGGAAHVQSTAGVTYAEYARRGFFELVWVTALTLGLLLGANGALRRERPRDEIVFRALAWTLLSLLGVVMLSAMQRMRLYQSAYGLTETRFYATVCMIWLAVVLAWFAATVLRGRGTPQFAFGGLVSAWLALAVLDVANPDAIIARNNLARLERGANFDATYVSTLSGDAVPVVVEQVLALGAKIPEADRCALELSVAEWRTTSRDDSWRRWNASRASARLAARDPHLVARFPGPCARPAVAHSP